MFAVITSCILLAVVTSGHQTPRPPGHAQYYDPAAMAELENKMQALQLSLWNTRDQLKETRRAFERLVANDAKRPLEPISVERRSRLTYDEFLREYASRGRPVIITDMLPVMFPDGAWDLDYLVSMCGDSTVDPFEFQADANVWGRLVHAGVEIPLEEFVERHRDADDEDVQRLYVHDWSLLLKCPAAFLPSSSRRFVVPKYFSDDLLQRLPAGRGLLCRDEWPSLFIGAKGSLSGLHVDSFGSNFWMMLLSGRKHWRFFLEGDRPFLYEDRAQSVFNVDAFRIAETEDKPLAKLAQPYDCVLEPGELLFVPAGAPHQVLNLEDSVAISGNYIDSTNFQRSLVEIGREAHAGVQESVELYGELSKLDGTYKANANHVDRSWSGFKNPQWRKTVNV